MKLLSKYFVVLFCLALLQSCNSNTEEIFTPQKLVSDGEVFSIKIDNQTPNISDGLVSFSTDINWLFNVNYTNNEIQLYNLDSKTLEKRMVFDLEGPDAVAFVFGIQVQSLDSIFIFDYPKNDLYLSDTSAKVKTKLQYHAPEGYTAAFVHNAHYSYKPILSKDRLLVNAKFKGNLREITNEQLSSKKLGYTIDLRNGDTKLLSVGWPSDYNGSGSKLLDFSMAAIEEMLVYSLVADHYLYVTDLNGKPIRKVFAKSEYLNQSFESFPTIDDRSATLNYVFASDRYERILYDEYRGVFYRFVFPKVDVTNEDELNILRRFPRKLSIMILDKKLNVIGETLMPENTYYPGNSFVSEDGLYISINHPNNPLNNEDLLSFEIFKLEELKD